MSSTIRITSEKPVLYSIPLTSRRVRIVCFTVVFPNFLIPFTPPSHKAAGDGAADLIVVDGAHPFRATAIDVRGRTVFVLASSLVLSPDQFAAFLPDADRLLRSFRFPR